MEDSVDSAMMLKFGLDPFSSMVVELHRTPEQNAIAVAAIYIARGCDGPYRVLGHGPPKKAFNRGTGLDLCLNPSAIDELLAGLTFAHYMVPC